MLTDEIERLIDGGQEVGASPEEIAAAIAKVCEEDKWDALKVLDETWHDIEDRHLADLAAAQAQAAGLVAALEALVACHGCKWDGVGEIFPPETLLERASEAKASQWKRAWKQAKQALSAVPKVLHSEEAKWDTEYLIWPVVRLQRAPMMDYRGPDDVMLGVTFVGHDPERYEKFPGKKARVIVLSDEQSKSVKRRLAVQQGKGE